MHYKTETQDNVTSKLVNVIYDPKNISIEVH